MYVQEKIAHFGLGNGRSTEFKQYIISYQQRARSQSPLRCSASSAFSAAILSNIRCIPLVPTAPYSTWSQYSQNTAATNRVHDTDNSTQLSNKHTPPLLLLFLPLQMQHLLLHPPTTQHTALDRANIVHNQTMLRTLCCVDASCCCNTLHSV